MRLLRIMIAVATVTVVTACSSEPTPGAEPTTIATETPDAPGASEEQVATTAVEEPPDTTEAAEAADDDESIDVCGLLTLEEVQTFAADAEEGEAVEEMSGFADTCTWWLGLSIVVHKTIDELDTYFAGAEEDLTLHDVEGLGYPAQVAVWIPDDVVSDSILSLVLDVGDRLLIVSPWNDTYLDTPEYEALKELAVIAADRL